MKVLLRKIIVFVLVFFYTGISVLSISLPVGAQSKKSAKKTARKSSSKQKKKTSSTSKSSTSSNKRKATSKTKSTKRSLASKRSKKRASTAKSTRRAAVVRKTIGKSLSFLNQLADNTTTNEQVCIDSYVECMDAQIDGVLGKFTFLTDDEAVEAALDTGQPFRCAFYDPNSVTLKTNADLLKDDKSTCVGLTAETCYTQRGVNELYNSYNYYCSINRSLKNNIGRKINQCDLSTGSSFATKYSVAYYNEVLKRMNGDGLQMINLENSTIYKNFISQLNLENEASYVMDSSVASQIMNQLNLEEETELFSVNVVPPLGANGYLASSQFNTASNKCFSAETTSLTSAKTKEDRDKMKSQNQRIAAFKTYGCENLRSNLERYYLTGKWEGVAVDDEGKQVEGATSEDITSAFFSAKESCGLYEQALISTRDKKYGEFDNQMQNWIEDNIAKMITKKIKSTASLAKVETSLSALDKQISFDMQKVQNEMELTKSKADGDIALKRAEIELEKANAVVLRNESTLQLAKTYASTYSVKVLSLCNDMISNNFATVCSKDGTSCFENKKIKDAFYSWGRNVSQYSVKLNRDGDIIPSHKNDKTNSEFANYISFVQTDADKSKKDGYYQLYCKDLDKFDYQIPFLLSLPGSVEKYGEDVRKEVQTYLETQFPIKEVGGSDD